MVGKTTFRALGQATNHNPETVRRYMSGQTPSVEFLSALVGAYSVSADWLLTGRGPMHPSQIRGEALTNANTEELMTAIACRMEDMRDRIDRIEVFVQRMESHSNNPSVAVRNVKNDTMRVAEIKTGSKKPGIKAG